MNSNTDVLEAPVQGQIVEVETGLSNWNLDAVHSNAGFSVRHLMISNVRGEFRQLTGTLQYDPADVEKSKLDVTIQVESIDTREPNRDGHLKSADFFEVEKYPEMTFRSTAWQQKNDDELIIKGDLTMHGMTHPVELTAERTPTMKDPWGGTRVGFTGKTKINRKDFGLHYNAALEAGGVVVGEHVSISLEAEFVKV
jgi:polyisoprenoid-binding protein YceI